MHDDVHPGDGLANHADLGQLGGCPAGDLCDPERGQLVLERLQLLGQLLLLLGAEVGALDADLRDGI